jgi:ankyrin repeat protein
MEENDWLENERLHFAAQDGDIEEVKKCIDEGFDVNAFDEDMRFTPLHYAVKNEHAEVALFLIENGADVNARDQDNAGNTPLCEVAKTCSYKIAKLLIDAGADSSIPGWMQLTAIDKAKKRIKGDGHKVYNLFLGALDK